MLAGQIIAAPAQTGWEAIDNTAIASVANTTPSNGSPVCGVAFTAPQSGHVLIEMSIDFDVVAGAIGVGGWRLRTGNVVGSGTIIDGTETLDGAHALTGRFVSGSTRQGTPRMCRVTGLTAGTTYNAAVYHYVTSGSTSAINARSLIVVPLI